MDINNRPEDIGDYLSQLHGGGWFGFTDSKNKIYSNLILHPKVWNPEYTGNVHEEGLMDNPYSKPTEKECTDGLKAMQDTHDANQYQRARAVQYPSIRDVVVALAEKEEGDDTMWKEITAKRQKVKADNPKPE